MFSIITLLSHVESIETGTVSEDQIALFQIYSVINIVAILTFIYYE